MLVLQLINHNVSSRKIVLMEDSNNNSYVAISEVMESNYTPERVGGATKARRHQIRVILKSVTKPNTVLPFKIQDDKDRVLCRTLDKVFLKNKGVLWLQSDTVLTQPDGCIISNWA